MPEELKPLRDAMQKDSTEEKIINAALREFAQHGYEGARIDRIAKRARINKAMIYYHFKSKEKLYEGILTNIFEYIHSSVKQRLPEGKGTMDSLYSFIDRYITIIDFIDQDIIRLMHREISAGGTYFRKIALPKLIVPVKNRVETIIQHCKAENLIKDINPNYTIFQLVGSVLFLKMLTIALKGTELEEIVFHENYLEDFKNNLLTILRSGVER